MELDRRRVPGPDERRVKDVRRAGRKLFGRPKRTRVLASKKQYKRREKHPGKTD